MQINNSITKPEMDSVLKKKFDDLQSYLEDIFMFGMDSEKLEYFSLLEMLDSPQIERILDKNDIEKIKKWENFKFWLYKAEEENFLKRNLVIKKINEIVDGIEKIIEKINTKIENDILNIQASENQVVSIKEKRVSQKSKVSRVRIKFGMDDFLKNLEETLYAINKLIDNKINIVSTKKIRRCNNIKSSNRSKINFIWRALRYLEEEGILTLYGMDNPKTYKIMTNEKINITKIFSRIEKKKKIQT